MTAQLLFELIGEADEAYIEHSEAAVARRRAKPLRAVIIAACAAALLIAGALAAAGALGVDFEAVIQGGFRESGADMGAEQLRAQLEDGEWVSLNGANIAVIVPSAPARILLSADGGDTWRESVVADSGSIPAWGDVLAEQYYGGWIGSFGSDGMYLALAGGTALGRQPLGLFLSGDSGGTWRAVDSPHTLGLYSGVVTGAAFANAEAGCVCYRYYEDAGPVIWRTGDGGASWERLELPVPAEYAQGGYCFTPGKPEFDGPAGRCRVTAYLGGAEAGGYTLVTDDCGENWRAE